MISPEKAMSRCLKLAKKAKGNVFPNPMVGAVIVFQGRIIGEGYHKKYGGSHAEVNAINSLKNKSILSKTTLYVSLEPCSHFGKTPPCTDVILKYKVPHVVVSVKDPNPEVNGKGVKVLKRNGVKVTVGLLKKKAIRLNDSFFFFHQNSRPKISLKIAQTLDGKTALQNGNSKWITSKESRAYAHKLRSNHQAIITTSNTVLKDDPLLTVRAVKGRNPLRIVLDRKLRIPLTAKVFNPDARTIIVSSKNSENSEKIRKLLSNRIEVIHIPERNKKLCLLALMNELFERKIISVLVESGTVFSTELIRLGLADKLYLFYGRMFFGDSSKSSVGNIGVNSINQAKHMAISKVKQFPDDFLVKGYFEEYKTIDRKLS